MNGLFFKGVFFALFFLFELSFANQVVVNNDKILSDEVVAKITALGNELASKSDIYVALGVYESLGGKSMNSFFKELDFKPPFVFLLLAKSEHKVEIFADEETIKLFNKEQILSPYPSSGSILPILSSKNGNDIYNASMLNGYADIVEQIAASKNIKLENAIGNQNKYALDMLRIIVYAMIAVTILVVLRAKFRRRNA